MHYWIGGKIEDNRDTDLALNYWWSEGFTEYCARLIAFRSKSMDRKAFIAQINQFLQAYYLSRVNLEPIPKNSEMEKLPYYRGLVFALYLNDRIQKESATHTLDDVMRDLVNAGSKQQSSSFLFKNIIRKYLQKGIAREFSHFIDKGNLISLEGVHLPVEKISRGRYDLGLNKARTIKRVQGVDNYDKNHCRNRSF